MQEVPDCLNRRYKALDELVKELNSVSHFDFNDEDCEFCSNDPGVRLMCEFWKILKEDPDCNLTKEIQQRMDIKNNSTMFRPQRLSCFMAAHNCLKKDDQKKKPDIESKIKNVCCHKDPEPDLKSKCCASRSVTPSQDSTDVLPLSKVLCNLKEAASFDRKCQGMISELMAAQKNLQDQIQHLEHREKEGIQLLKQADCMWSCMEDAYKKKILESQERQQELIKQLKEAEANANRWRKNKKDLELQLENVNTCHQEIFEKLHQKQNDLKCMNMDIASYKKRIDNNKKEIEAVKKSLSTKKQASDDKIKKISDDISRKEAMIRAEKARKEEKDAEGNQYIKDAREDLLNLSRILLQKNIENENMKTEKETLMNELELLSQTYDQCKDRCQAKKQSIEDELKIIDNEIANYKVKCARCHQCTDTIDIRKFCTDCPRCLEERECLYKEDHCSPDHTMDCVCMSVKHKFLDNVFENMYTVLERQIKTGPGKAVAEAVLNRLKRSRNGKLDRETRQILQDFILTTVKKNLNLTIVGGAVKTRCELDSDTYKQLMLCLKQVKAVRPPKADKETAAKKDPCRRWGGASECNCPKGPKECICTKKAPPPPDDPSPCPPQDKEDTEEVKVCPYKESAACGPDCAMHAVPSAVGTDVAAWRPDPCHGPTCQFKNMRAAQCVLGPEAINATSSSKSYVTAVPYVPNIMTLDNQNSCKCGSSSNKSCVCNKDSKQFKVDKRQCSEKMCKTLLNKSNKHELYIISPEKAENNVHVVTKEYSSISQATNCNEISLKRDIKVDSKIKEDLIKEQFKPLSITNAIVNKEEPIRYFPILKNRESNQSKLPKTEINEKLIGLIENITRQNPNNFISLKKTKSGHLTMGLNSIADNDNIIIKRSPSGNMVIEVDNNIIETLNSKERLNSDSKSRLDLERNDTISSSVENSNNIKRNINDKISEDTYSDCKMETNNITDLLKHKYKNGQKYVNVRVTNNDKNIKTEKAPLTQMSCEDMAIHIKNPGLINDDRLEIPVTLHMSQSSILNIFFNNDVPVSSTIATRTISDGFLIHEKQLGYQEEKPLSQNVTEVEKLVRIKIRGLDSAISEPPALIQKTPSGNFDIIFEKEFEKYYQKEIKHQIGEKNDSCFEIIYTPSGVILDFEKNDRVRSDSKKALLMKSHSGLLKIIVSDSVQNKKEDIAMEKNNFASGSIISAKALGELLRKLPCSRTKTHNNNLQSIRKKKTAIITKSTSDSHLYETARNMIHSSKSLLEKSSTTLKKTKSGQYAIVLDKESKKSFINHLIPIVNKDLFTKKRVIPIKRSKSGEIIIVLDGNTNNIDDSGTLKITESGSIYIILDEKAFNQISNNVAVNTSSNLKAENISPYISKIENPENKAIATNCNAYPDSSICDISKCSCKRLNSKKDDISNSYTWNFLNGSDNSCEKGKCSRECDKQSIKLNNKSPHIVIKPNESRPVPEKHNKFQESYYCEVQSICPYHKDRYEDVSNELLEISSLCNKAQEEQILSKVKTNLQKNNGTKPKKTVTSNQDYLDFLPPQLPPFLRNFIYD